MIASPRIGQAVQVWYGPRWRAVMPLHGLVGTVTATSRPGTRPRNHAVTIAGQTYIVPCGNLRKPPEPLSCSA